MNDMSVKYNKLSNNTSRISSLLNMLYIISQKSSTHRIEPNKALIFEFFWRFIVSTQFLCSRHIWRSKSPAYVVKSQPTLEFTLRNKYSADFWEFVTAARSFSALDFCRNSQKTACNSIYSRNWIQCRLLRICDSRSVVWSSESLAKILKVSWLLKTFYLSNSAASLQ